MSDKESGISIPDNSDSFEYIPVEDVSMNCYLEYRPPRGTCCHVLPDKSQMKISSPESRSYVSVPDSQDEVRNYNNFCADSEKMEDHRITDARKNYSSSLTWFPSPLSYWSHDIRTISSRQHPATRSIREGISSSRHRAQLRRSSRSLEMLTYSPNLFPTPAQSKPESASRSPSDTRVVDSSPSVVLPSSRRCALRIW